MCFFGIFEIGSAVCGAATSSTMLIIGRSIAGLGGSGILNGCYTVLHVSVPRERQPCTAHYSYADDHVLSDWKCVTDLLGGLMGISQIGVLSGPLIGGALTEYASWRWCKFCFRLLHTRDRFD